MILPFLYLFILIFQDRGVVPKWMAFNNPLIYYILLKLLTLVLPDSGLRLAFINGLMSESMFLCFAVFLWAGHHYMKRVYKRSKFPIR